MLKRCRHGQDAKSAPLLSRASSLAMAKDKSKHAEPAEDGDVTMTEAADSPKVFTRSLRRSYAHNASSEKGQEGEGGRRHQHTGAVAYRAPPRTKEALEEAAQNAAERCANANCFALGRAHVRAASKQRQVKRGVKEVVKGIRKGEKG